MMSASITSRHAAAAPEHTMAPPLPVRWLAALVGSGLWIIVASLALTEGALRLLHYGDRYMSDPVYTPLASAPDPADSYVHKPGLRAAHGRGGAVFDTDDLGLRTTDPDRRIAAKAPDELRIAFFGDSFTFGEGVERTEDVYAERVARSLTARTGGRLRVQAFNFGVSGYNVRQMTAALEYWSPPAAPDACVLSLIPSDFSLEWRKSRVGRDGYTFNTGRSGTLLSPDGPVLRLLRHLHVAYFLRSLKAQYVDSPKATRAVDELPAAFPAVRRFVALARERGCPSAVIGLPNFNDNAALIRLLAADGIRHLDLDFLLEEMGAERFAASSFDLHPGPAAHAAIAAHVADHLMGVIPALATPAAAPTAARAAPRAGARQ
jgi:hypothetical protein